jgi:WD40 repeat protein
MCKVAGKWDPMVSVVYWNDRFVSGGSEGVLYLWTGSNSVTTKGHEGRVDCLRVDSSGVLYSGCSLGVVNRWKYSGGKIVLDQKVLSMKEIDKYSPGVLSLDFSADCYLVCTNSSSIYEIDKNAKNKVNVIM